MRRRAFLGLALAASALSACGSVVGNLGGDPPDLFILTPKSSFTGSLPKVDWQLVVEEPTASGGLNTARIARRSNPTELAYFAKASWTDRAPVMVQTLLVESFENSGAIVAVGRKAIGLRSDYDLKSELREFQAEYDDAPTPLIRVRLNVKLIKQPRRSIVAFENFEATQRAAAGSMEAVVAAFDEALGKVLRQVVQWTLVNGQGEGGGRVDRARRDAER
jgi:cholesterol transport system auxiliary component